MASRERAGGKARAAVLRISGALAAGVAMILTFAPFGAWWLQPGLLAILFTLWAAVTPRHAALIGFAFGLGWFGAGVSWVYISMHDVGGMPMSIAGLATFLFACILALYPALAGWLQARLAAGRPRPWMQALIVTPAALTLGEWLRGWVFTGFPWIAPGYAHTDGPLAGYAPLVGVHGLTYLAVLAGGLLALAFAQWRTRRSPQSAMSPATPPQPLVDKPLHDMPRRGAPGAAVMASAGGSARTIAGAIALLGLLCVAGAGLRGIGWTAAVGKPLAVALLQANVPQELKFVEGRFEATIETYARLAHQHQATLIVLPETALPRMLHTIPLATLQRLDSLASERGATLMSGVPRAESATRYFNSAISLGREAGQRYDKSHLVPFGEFIPYGFRWFVDLMRMPLGNFTPGDAAQPPMRVAGQHIAVNICYEDLFGEEIIGQLPEATLLLNLSNVGWFGNSLAPHQHLQASRMRAMETGRVMLRATNTGATAVIDAQGHVTHALPFFTEGALAATVQGRSGATPYVYIGRSVGNGAVSGFCVLALIACAWRVRQRRPADVRA